MVPGLRNPERGAQTWELSQKRGSRAVGAFESEGPSRLHPLLLSKVLLRWAPSVLALHIHYATLVTSGVGGWQFIAFASSYQTSGAASPVTEGQTPRAPRHGEGRTGRLFLHLNPAGMTDICGFH